MTTFASQTPWCKNKITSFSGMKGYGGQNPRDVDPGAIVIGTPSPYRSHQAWTWVPVSTVPTFDFASKKTVKIYVVDFESPDGVWFSEVTAAELDLQTQNFFYGYIFPEAAKARALAVADAKKKALEAKKKKAKAMGLTYPDYLKHLADLQSKKDEAKKINVVMNFVKDLNLVKSQVDQAINTLTDKRFLIKQLTELEQAHNTLRYLVQSIRKAKIAVDAKPKKARSLQK